MTEKNNFNLMRLLLALSVLLVHSAGISDVSKLSFVLRYLNGDVIVKCFFAISGYLIALSFQRNDKVGFFLKRAKRILPAYYVALVVMLLVGVFLTSLPRMKFVFDSGVIKCILSNLFFMSFIHPSLPGVFDSNPITAINGSLWTIKSEIMLYLVTSFVLSRTKRCMLPLLIMYCASVA